MAFFDDDWFVYLLFAYNLWQGLRGEFLFRLPWALFCYIFWGLKPGKAYVFSYCGWEGDEFPESGNLDDFEGVYLGKNYKMTYIPKDKIYNVVSGKVSRFLTPGRAGNLHVGFQKGIVKNPVQIGSKTCISQVVEFEECLDLIKSNIIQEPRFNHIKVRYDHPEHNSKTYKIISILPLIFQFKDLKLMSLISALFLIFFDFIAVWANPYINYIIACLWFIPKYFISKFKYSVRYKLFSIISKFLPGFMPCDNINFKVHFVKKCYILTTYPELFNAVSCKDLGGCSHSDLPFNLKWDIDDKNNPSRDGAFDARIMGMDGSGDKYSHSLSGYDDWIKRFRWFDNIISSNKDAFPVVGIKEGILSFYDLNLFMRMLLTNGKKVYRLELSSNFNLIGDEIGSLSFFGAEELSKLDSLNNAFLVKIEESKNIPNVLIQHNFNFFNKAPRYDLLYDVCRFPKRNSKRPLGVSNKKWKLYLSDVNIILNKSVGTKLTKITHLGPSKLCTSILEKGVMTDKRIIDSFKTKTKSKGPIKMIHFFGEKKANNPPLGLINQEDFIKCQDLEKAANDLKNRIEGKFEDNKKDKKRKKKEERKGGVLNEDRLTTSLEKITKELDSNPYGNYLMSFPQIPSLGTNEMNDRRIWVKNEIERSKDRIESFLKEYIEEMKCRDNIDSIRNDSEKIIACHLESIRKLREIGKIWNKDDFMRVKEEASFILDYVSLKLDNVNFPKNDMKNLLKETLEQNESKHLSKMKKHFFSSLTKELSRAPIFQETKTSMGNFYGGLMAEYRIEWVKKKARDEHLQALRELEKSKKFERYFTECLIKEMGEKVIREDFKTVADKRKGKAKEGEGRANVKTCNFHSGGKINMGAYENDFFKYFDQVLLEFPKAERKRVRDRLSLKVKKDHKNESKEKSEKEDSGSRGPPRFIERKLKKEDHLTNKSVSSMRLDYSERFKVYPKIEDIDVKMSKDAEIEDKGVDFTKIFSKSFIKIKKRENGDLNLEIPAIKKLFNPGKVNETPISKTRRKRVIEDTEIYDPVIKAIYYKYFNNKNLEFIS